MLLIGFLLSPDAQWQVSTEYYGYLVFSFLHIFVLCTEYGVLRTCISLSGGPALSGASTSHDQGLTNTQQLLLAVASYRARLVRHQI